MEWPKREAQLDHQAGLRGSVTGTGPGTLRVGVGGDFITRTPGARGLCIIPNGWDIRRSGWVTMDLTERTAPAIPSPLGLSTLRQPDAPCSVSKQAGRAGTRAGRTASGSSKLPPWTCAHATSICAVATDYVDAVKALKTQLRDEAEKRTRALARRSLPIQMPAVSEGTSVEKGEALAKRPPGPLKG